MLPLDSRPLTPDAVEAGLLQYSHELVVAEFGLVEPVPGTMESSVTAQEAPFEL